MAGVGALISSLLSSVHKLLPEVKNSFFASSSSSPTQSLNLSVVENDLNKLMITLEKTKMTLSNVEESGIIDRIRNRWLKELKEVGHDAEYVLDEYMYEVYRAQVKDGSVFDLNPHKRKGTIKIPDGIVDRIREIMIRFDEIAKGPEVHQFHEEDGSWHDVATRFGTPSNHSILESNIFGRNMEKENVIDLLFPNMDGKNNTVIPIVGMGGLGKTTLAQLVYNDIRVKENFDLFGWTHVSEDFNVERSSKI